MVPKGGIKHRTFGTEFPCFFNDGGVPQQLTFALFLRKHDTLHQASRQDRVVSQPLKGGSHLALFGVQAPVPRNVHVFATTLLEDRAHAEKLWNVITVTCVPHQRMRVVRIET